MPKASKSSASSATKKKQAFKAAKRAGGEPQIAEIVPKSKKGKKADKSAPRVKVYIAPVKPSAPRPDPLDAFGLASQLPPELVVTLRGLGKKDSVTKGKALDELQAQWIERAAPNTGNEDAIGVVELMLPVWYHHYPTLVLHPSRRIRSSAASIHALLWTIPAIRASILFFLHETADLPQLEQFLGAWSMSVFDVDYGVSSRSKKSWEDYVAPSSSHGMYVPAVATFLQQAIMAPASIHILFNPPASEPIPASTPLRGKRPAGRGGMLLSRTKEAEDRVKSDVEEEPEEDRDARYRIGGMGVLKWLLEMISPDQDASAGGDAVEAGAKRITESVLPMFSDEMFWSSLYHGPHPPWVSETTRGNAFGHAQPIVRRSAWAILTPLVRRWKGHIEQDLSVISSAVLRSSWVESDSTVQSAMWEPLLIFLTTWPAAWLIDAGLAARGSTRGPPLDDEASDHSDYESDLDERDERQPSLSVAYIEFLDFLKLGCSGSPVKGYPVVIVVLSSIPSEILSLDRGSLDTLFGSFWAAVDGRALSAFDKSTTSAAFIASLLECLVFLVGLVHKRSSGVHGEPLHSDSETFIREQFAEVWSAMEPSRLKVDSIIAGDKVGKALARLEDLNVAFFEAAWASISVAITNSVTKEREDVHSESIALNQVQALAALDAGIPSSRTYSKTRVWELVHSLIEWSVRELSSLAERPRADANEISPDYPAVAVTSLMRSFGDGYLASAGMVKIVSEVLSGPLDNLVLTLSPSILAGLLMTHIELSKHPNGDEGVWRNLLKTLGSSKVPRKISVAVIQTLLNRSKTDKIRLTPEGRELSGLVEEVLDDVLGEGNAVHITFLASLFVSFEPFVTNSIVEQAIQRLATTVTETVQDILHDPETEIHQLNSALSILSPLVSSGSALALADDVVLALLPSTLILGFIVPLLEDENGHLRDPIAWARKLSSMTFSLVPPAASLNVREKFLSLVHELVQDVRTNIRASAIIDVVTSRELPPALGIGSAELEDVLPPRQVFDAHYATCSVGYVDGPFSLLNPDLRQPPIPRIRFDKYGLSAYARITSALLHVSQSDHEFAQHHVWATRHLILLECQAEDYIMDDEEDNAMFGPGAHIATVRQLRQNVSRALSYGFAMLMNNITEKWHTAMCGRLKGTGGHSTESNDPLAAVVEEGYWAAVQSESLSVKDIRVFRRLLHLVLKAGDTGPSEAEPWLMLAQTIQQKAPQTSISIILVIVQLGIESPRLDRIRNETASSLSGVPPARANSEGIRLLRQLVASAPPPDSDVALLPQQRAIFVLQSLQKWIASDEDLNEEVDSLLVWICTDLSPVIQSVPGAHWDFMFDLMESNLEASSLKDKTTYVNMRRALDLVIKVDELSESNKALRSIWQERRASVLALVADRVVEPIHDLPKIDIRQTLQEKLLAAARDLRVQIPEVEGFTVLCNLLLDSSLEIQLQIYHILGPLVAKRSERLVLDAAIESESTASFELPTPLLNALEIIQPAGLGGGEDQDSNEKTSSFLLAWMITMEFFNNVSIKIKNGYIEQLKTSRLVESRLLPGLFSVLGIGAGRKVFPVDMWAVDEFYISLLDDSLPVRLHVLAAHLYYRALITIPSLVRSWFQDSRERKLTEALSFYTSRSFTPIIVSRELARLKDTDAAEDLVDEHLVIKVAAAVREVTAVYSVDDQPMEIGVNFPLDFPLHNVGVRDGQKLGISEVKWRAWLLNVQLVAQQTGSLVDALSLWKRNVSLHFEGEQECAICYSVISVSDRSLPKKPCNTCNNRFHASCLYKWFNTSHNSTCPLCRSNIL